MCSIGRFVALLFAVSAAWIGASSESAAQSDARENTQSPALGVEQPASPASPKTAPQGASKRTVELKGPDGKKVVLPKEHSLEKYIEYLKRSRGPEFAINSIELSGAAVAGHAELTATLTIQVRRDGWHQVPLYLNEAVFRNTEYRFLGARPGGDKPVDKAGQAAFKDFDRAEGYRWWFKGTGYHRLTLTMSVPVAKSVAQRRLRLSLPPLSAASTLALRVAEPNLQTNDVTGPTGADVRVRRKDRGHAEIDVIGLGAQLDLQWRSIPKWNGGPPPLQSQTFLLVNVSGESVVVTALQRVQPLNNGAMTSVRVRLPAGFDVLAATGKFVDSHTFDSKTRWAEVKFKPSRGEWTEIRWMLQRPFDERSGRLSLDGFDVEHASVQTGEIAVARTRGLRIVRVEDGNPDVHQIEPSRLTAQELIGNTPIASAFVFIKQPLTLQFQASQLEPQVTVKPEIRLHFSRDRITLQAQFAVNVSEEGRPVESLRVEWPEWKKEGWTLDPFAASARIDKRIVNTADDSSSIVFRLAGRSNGDFEVPLSATRTIKPGVPIPLSLPLLKARVAHPITLVVSRDANVAVELVDSEKSPLSELRGRPNAALARTYRVDGGSAPLTAEVLVHPRRIRAETSLELNPQPADVAVRQQLSYRVEYEDVPSVVLRVPRQIADIVQFFDDKNRPLNTMTAPDSDEDSRLVEIVGVPTLGTIAFTAAYSVPLERALKQGETLSAALPLVRFADVDFSRIRVRTASGTPLAASVVGENWRRLTMPDGSAAWSNASPLRRLEVELNYPSIPRSGEFSIPRALIRAVVGRDGTIRYRAQYRTSGAGEAVVAILPPEIRIDSIWWGKRKVADLPPLQKTAGETACRIPLPASGGTAPGSTLLTIDYSSTKNAALRWISRESLVAPRFPQNVWVDQTAWQVVLPQNQHLTSYDADYFPEFRWRRTTAMWKRTPTDRFEDPSAWIGDEGPEWREQAGNVYCFRRFGPAAELTLGSTSRSAIVLFGAGLAWLLGVLWVKLPVLRNAVTLLTAMLATAVASLWFSEELLVMLQPAALGLGLAVAFVGIERFARRRRIVPQITTANPSDFVLSTASLSFNEKREPVPLGSDDPTVHRDPAPASSSVPAPSSELRGKG